MRRTLFVSIAVVAMLAVPGFAQAREPYKGAIRTVGNSVLYVDAHADLSGQLNFASGDPAEDDFNVHCDGFDTFEVVDATTVHLTASAPAGSGTTPRPRWTPPSPTSPTRPTWRA